MSSSKRLSNTEYRAVASSPPSPERFTRRVDGALGDMV